MTTMALRWKTLTTTALLMAVIVWAGCSGGGGDDDDEVTLSASTFSGTFASDIDTGSFSFTIVSAASDSTFGLARADAGLSGTIVSARLGTLTVPGTWDAELNDLRLESPSGSSPLVQILGSFDGDVLRGFTAGDLGFGAAAAVPDDGNFATSFCGDFTRSSGATGGRFNLVVGARLAQVSVFDDLDGQPSSFGGSVSGATIDLNDGDGTTASGTLSGNTVSGSWSDDEGDGGDWSGSSGACGAS